VIEKKNMETEKNVRKKKLMDLLFEDLE